LPFNFYLADGRHDVDPFTVHICATHCELNKRERYLKLENASGVISHYNPSVDHLFNSAVKLCREYDVLAILLTGIGQDGAQGLSDLKDARATCIAESEESAIVYGMPKKAAELNSSIKVMNLDQIIAYIKRFGD
jgi:two-component system chemotaxis response regulator CheB